MRQVFAVHRSHCQIYSRYRRFRLTTRFLLFFSFWRWSPIGGRVRLQTSKDDDGVEEVEEDENDDTAQRARDSRTEKGKKKHLNESAKKKIKIIMHTDNKRLSNICSLLDTFPPLRDDAQI